MANRAGFWTGRSGFTRNGKVNKADRIGTVRHNANLMVKAGVPRKQAFKTAHRMFSAANR